MNANSGRLARRLLIFLVIVALLVLAGWRLTRPQPVAVVLHQVERGRVEVSVANTRAGTVDACRRARLAPPAGGQIIALPVQQGDRVRAGQVLLELWHQDVAAEMRAAREQTNAARLRAEEACSRAQLAERDAERARLLHAGGLIPEEQFDRAGAAARTAQAACSAAQADVEQSQARIAAAHAARERTVLRAPFAGVIADIRGELGEFTTPSPPGIPTPPAVDLIDDSCLYVTAPIDEVDAPRVRLGQTGYITIDAFPGRRFLGRVRRIAPYVLDLERQARTVDVEVEFADPEDVKVLLVGYSADVEVILSVREDVVRIPTQALAEGNRVFVYRAEDRRLEERQLELGATSWEYTEVLSGLSEGERIVLSVEREGVRDGALVEPEGEAGGGPRP